MSEKLDDRKTGVVAFEDTVWDKVKGELIVLGSRHAAVDLEALCRHLDALVGAKVAEVIIDNHQFRLGKEDAARLREARPRATIHELLDSLIEAESLSGFGIAKLTLDETPGAIVVEISNPVVRGTAGGARSFMFSYWSGVLSFLLDKDLQAKDIVYDVTENLLKCRIVERAGK
jgi:hypothetical protein